MSKEKQRKQAEACSAETGTGNNSNNIDDDNRTDIKDVADGEEKPDETQKDLHKELDEVKLELEEKAKKCAEYFEKLQRTAAEYDNYKKRTAKEKEALYIDAVADVTGAFLPVLDNIERALQAMAEDNSAPALKEGVEMVFKQFKEVLKSMNVEEIKALNEKFDPMLHNAVMHVEDEALGHNVIVEEFQKGYICKGRVIRYSMVKVAN